MPTLLIMAAGMGSRYGGLKQIDPIGPHQETIIDYSIFDSLRAGFNKIIFIIRREFEVPFKQTIISKFEKEVETIVLFQELSSCMEGFEVPPGRKKPWGTSQAVLIARDWIHEPFAVINADDFYGADSFKGMAGFLSGGSPQDENRYAMVGFNLMKTLSEYGHVSRGVCEHNSRMYLKDIVERTHIIKTPSGASYVDDAGNEYPLRGDEVASMNFWGFQPSIFAHLKEKFRRFLEEKRFDPKAEFFIPTVVGELIADNKAVVKIVPTEETWFGLTYKEDKDMAKTRINALIRDGVYPEKLWK